MIGQELDDVAPLPSCSGTDWGRTLDVLIFVFVQWMGLGTRRPFLQSTSHTERVGCGCSNWSFGQDDIIQSYKQTPLHQFAIFCYFYFANAWPTLTPSILFPFCSLHFVMFLLHHIQMHKVPFGVREQHSKALPDAEETCG